MDLFDNPVGYRTSLGKMLRILMFFSGNCSETEVSEQLKLVFRPDSYPAIFMAVKNSPQGSRCAADIPSTRFRVLCRASLWLLSFFS
jgi:hypothetical protein